MKPNSIENPLFYEAEVLTRTRETGDTFTYCFSFVEKSVQKSFRFLPGQFHLLDIPTLGVYASVITSNPSEGNFFEHTFQFNSRKGSEYRIVEKLMEGTLVKVAGPFGRGWTSIDMGGKNILMIASGLGLRSLKPMINYIAQNRVLFDKVEVLYSVKTPKDFLYMDEYESWDNANIDMMISVENIPQNFSWNNRKGMIVGLLKDMKSNPNNTIVLMSGPEMTLKYAVYFLEKQHYQPEQVYVSLDYLLNSGEGKIYAGPIFNLSDIKMFY
ncbi:MAG: hypothetical protein AB1420_05355 [Bacillota bacterium]